MLEQAGLLAIGALITLITTRYLERNRATRAARRDTYLELLAMLKAALRVQQTATYDLDSPIPDIMGDDKVDAFNARIEVDTSPQARDLARQALRLIQRFNVSHVMRVPIDVDQNGLYRHRFDLVRGVDEDSAALQMRMSLGKIHDELVAVVDRLSARVRRELHAGR